MEYHYQFFVEIPRMLVFIRSAKLVASLGFEKTSSKTVSFSATLKLCGVFHSRRVGL